jgi:hypothetical protein
LGQSSDGWDGGGEKQRGALKQAMEERTVTGGELMASVSRLSGN